MSSPDNIHDMIVYERLKEVCPLRNPEDMTRDELLRDSNVAFKIIGYSPQDLEKVVTLVYTEKNHVHLYEFVYEVWRLDNA